MKNNMKNIFLSILIILLAVSCNNNKKEQELIDQANKIHKEIISIDTHTDTPLRLFRSDFDLTKRNIFQNDGSRFDFPRMEEGGIDAVFFAIFTGQGTRDEEGYKKVTARTEELFDSVFAAMERSRNLAELAYSTSNIEYLKSTGKKAVLLGMENGYPVMKDLAKLKEFYNKGIRYITLCHTKNNDICDSSTDDNGPEFDGLSDFGVEVVKEMNRLGMIVDISHVSDKAFYDVIELSEVPVMASHSCVRALCDNPRNMTDDMIKRLAENGGVIQIAIFSDYIKEIPEDSLRVKAFDDLKEKYNDFKDLNEIDLNKARKEWHQLDQKYPKKLATVSDLVDHIEHVIKIAGVDFVGIGSDFDGGGGIDGCQDVSEMKNITIELLKRGYSKEDIAKIWGGNFLRVFKTVEEYALQN